MGADGGLVWFKFREPVIPGSARDIRFKDLTSWMGVAQNFKWPSGCVHTQEEDVWPQPPEMYWVGSYGTNEDQFQLTYLPYFLEHLQWHVDIGTFKDWTWNDLYEDILTDPLVQNGLGSQWGWYGHPYLDNIIDVFVGRWPTYHLRDLSEPCWRWDKVSAMLISDWLQEINSYIHNYGFAHQEEIWT